MLLEEHEFNFVAIEADFPDAYRINRYVGGASDLECASDQSARSSLGDFSRYPSWMWRNPIMLE